MKYKTSELTGELLDAAVAKAEGENFMVERSFCGIVKPEYNRKSPLTASDLEVVHFDEDRCFRAYISSIDKKRKPGFWLAYSQKWELGGPIIEREHISIDTHCWDEGPALRSGWRAAVALYGIEINPRPKFLYGPTPLIAAMRAFIRSRLGDEVELP